MGGGWGIRDRVAQRWATIEERNTHSERGAQLYVGNIVADLTMVETLGHREDGMTGPPNKVHW